MDNSEKIKRALLVQEYNNEWKDANSTFTYAIRQLMSKGLKSQRDWANMCDLKSEHKLFLEARGDYKMLLIDDKIGDALDFTERYFFKIDSILADVLKSLSPENAQLTL